MSLKLQTFCCWQVAIFIYCISGFGDRILGEIRAILRWTRLQGRSPRSFGETDWLANPRAWFLRFSIQVWQIFASCLSLISSFLRSFRPDRDPVSTISLFQIWAESFSGLFEIDYMPTWHITCYTCSNFGFFFNKILVLKTNCYWKVLGKKK